jgi:hypothetical protein
MGEDGGSWVVAKKCVGLGAERYLILDRTGLCIRRLKK